MNPICGRRTKLQVRKGRINNLSALRAAVLALPCLCRRTGARAPRAYITAQVTPVQLGLLAPGRSPPAWVVWGGGLTRTWLRFRTSRLDRAWNNAQRMTAPSTGQPTPSTTEHRKATRQAVEQRVANATPQELARVKALQERAAKTRG
jgi:hypothetical protein